MKSNTTQLRMLSAVDIARILPGRSVASCEQAIRGAAVLKHACSDGKWRIHPDDVPRAFGVGPHVWERLAAIAQLEAGRS